MRETIEKGSITLPTKDILRYKSDCESFMEDIGSIVMKDIVISSDTGYYLVFYDPKREYTLEEQQDCFFTIYYDKDRNFSFYTKGIDRSIPKDIRYEIMKA